MSRNTLQADFSSAKKKFHDLSHVLQWSLHVFVLTAWAHCVFATLKWFIWLWHSEIDGD